MDTLPQFVIKMLEDISREHKLQSWRVYGEENIVVSLRFQGSSHIGGTNSDNTDYATGIGHTSKGQFYRSKPPTSVRRDSDRRINWLNRQNQDTPIQLKSTTLGDTDYSINTITDRPTHSQYGFQDSGIDISINNNVLSSTVVAGEAGTLTDQYVHTNGDNHNDLLTLKIDNSSNTNTGDREMGTQTSMDNDSCISIHQQTCPPNTNSNFCQTYPSVNRKTQTRNLNSCFRRVQTLPIQQLNVSTQHVNLTNDSKQTMTLIVDQAEAGTLTMPLKSRHAQTENVAFEDKASGIETASTLSPHKSSLPPNCKSVRMQTENPLQYLQTRPIQGQPYSDIWVQSATDFLSDNANALAMMTQTLNSLDYMCDEDERRQHSRVS